MTDPGDRPTATDAVSLASYQRALPRLATLLRGADLPVSADRWQNLYDLLLALNAQGRLPLRAAALEHLFAPLLCRSAREQQQFADLFARWLQDLEPALRGEDEVDPAPVPTPPEPPPGPRLRWWLLGLALLLAVIAGTVYWLNLETQPPPEQRPPNRESITPRPAPEVDASRQGTHARELQPVPPRAPLERPTLDPAHRALRDTLGDLFLVLPGFFALAWLLLRWLTWKTVLKRRKGNPDDPLTAIGLDARGDDLLDAPALREALKRLHNPVAVPTRRLDPDATVARTARHGGLFQPVRRDRRTVPELVVLLEQRRAGDQMAGLAGQLVDRLRAAGLTVHRYDYRDSPRRLVGLDGRWRALGEIAARHEGARLLLIGEPAALIDSFSGEPLPWTQALAPWTQRALLVTRRPPARWQSALATGGFLVAELDSAGVQTLALRLSDERATPETALPGLTVALPRLLQDARRWTQPLEPPPSDRNALIAALDAYLGEEGTHLLAALAVYPQLHWGLTRVLDLSLFPSGDSADRERRLLKIARLPWGRAGWLPDWLRAVLLDRLGADDERAIRGLYRELLKRETATGGGRIALPVALPCTVGLRAGLWYWLRHKSWRPDRWLSALRDLSADHAALNDAIFADVLFGWRPPVLDFVIPRRLFQRRLGGALGQALAPRLVLALVLALGGAWLAADAWHKWGRKSVELHLLAMQNAAHAAYGVTIWHREATVKLAQALKATLEDDGFAPKIADTALTLPAEAVEPLPSVNKIQWGDPGDVPMAAHIEQRLTYLTWGQDPEVTNKLGPLTAVADLSLPPGVRELRVLLSTAGSTGSDFADPLAHKLMPEQIAEFVPPSEPLQEQAPARAVEPVQSFRDVLKDGGEGPEMVMLPNGSFLMGAPDDEPERDSDEGPQRRVTVQPFAIGRTEVSFADYDRFADASGSEKPDDQGWGRGDRPVINVSWNDAQAYAAWLSEQTGETYRLPSEAEWEYAARAGTETPFWTGGCIHTDQANYDGNDDYNGCGAKTAVYRAQTVPTGSLPPNVFGLHEIAGNAWEWVEDCVHQSYEGAPTDGSAWLEAGGGDCARRVLRGGGWFGKPWVLRSASRFRFGAGAGFNGVGIRLARTP